MERKILVVSSSQDIRLGLQIALGNIQTVIHFVNKLDDIQSNLAGCQYNMVVVDTKHAILLQAGTTTLLEKPVAIEACVAQMNTLLQERNNTYELFQNNFPLVFGSELIIDPQYHLVFVRGINLSLTKTEFELLFFMARHPKQVLSRKQLYEQVWGNEPAPGTDATVKVHIAAVRKKLSISGKKYIQNIRGVGYRFLPPDID